MISLLILLASIAYSCPEVQTTQIDLTEYTRASWYIQQQQVNGYQRESNLFCVTATYGAEEGKTVPGFSGTVVSVDNYANSGGVNIQQQWSGQGGGKPDFGRRMMQERPSGTDSQQSFALCARQPDKAVTGKLLVAPCFLPNTAAGSYWVMGVGTDENGLYTWAVVSGGPPTEQFEDGCTTRETGTNDAGLWILTRERTGAEKSVAEARNRLVELGYTLQRLKDVVHEGCRYEGAKIKPNSVANPTCEDVQPPVWWANNSCAKQKSSGKCPKRVQKNSMYCKKTCGMCGAEAPATYPTCHDLEPPAYWRNNSCAKQQASGKCAKRKGENSMYCRKTCGMC